MSGVYAEIAPNLWIGETKTSAYAFRYDELNLALKGDTEIPTIGTTKQAKEDDELPF